MNEYLNEKSDTAIINSLQEELLIGTKNEKEIPPDAVDIDEI